MPPKFDPNEIKIVNLRCVGGEVGATSSLAPKIGPLGLVSLFSCLYHNLTKFCVAVSCVYHIFLVTRQKEFIVNEISVNAM
ncbi:unnamed protein product [Parnassius mnemosyne]|uniref:Uncharacterized protein n=1 Tax=Parnassius mnemosyne TaxID=213953 RepID=A0AAV1KRM9_9NEOP